MINLESDIRNGVRALIVRENRILLQRKNSPAYGDRYTLPGGTQEVGETLESALIRECEEEMGTTVRVLELVHVADYRKRRGTPTESFRQMVEFLFTCRVPDDYQAANGPHPDKHQIDIVWMPLERLADLPFYPARLRQVLGGSDPDASCTYLGLIE